jgi:hypothetical protein
VPAIVSRSAAAAATGGPTPIPGCAALSFAGCLPALLTLWQHTNNCGIPIVLENGTVIQPGQSGTTFVGPGGGTSQVFVADAQGKPVGPPFQTDHLSSCH